MWNELPRPVIIAHRGDKNHAPENTVAAFAMAADKGAPAVEFDVKLTADGRVVVLHDATLDRTTDGTGKLRDSNFESLQKLDAGNWFAPQFKGERIPLLDEVFEAVGKRLHMNIELTNYTTPGDDLVSRVVGLVKKHDMQDRIIFSSFFARNLWIAKALLPEAPRGLLAWSGWAGYPARSWGWKRDCFALHPYLTDTNIGLVQRLHAAGCQVNVWTVNSAADLKQVIGLGVDGIFTDDPQLALHLIGKGP
jgi:glycerophosphoryl diester phosphodiesterase